MAEQPTPLLDWVPGTVLLSGIVGSTAYGLAGPDSDVDRLGCYAAPTAAFHGLDLPIDKAATVSRKAPDPDHTLHEARKFVSLCMVANPTVTELLWLPEDLYEVRHPLGRLLIKWRREFIRADKVRAAYLGYASQQLARLRETGLFASKQRARAEKHGRHLLRLLDQGVGFYTTGVLTVRVNDPQRYFDFGRRIAEDPQLGVAELARAERIFDGCHSPLPTEVDRACIEAWLLNVRALFFLQPQMKALTLA